MASDLVSTITMIVKGMIDGSFKTAVSVATKSVRTITKEQKKTEVQTKKNTNSYKKMNMALLGSMFAGMAMVGMFKSMYGPVSDLFGITELWGVTLQLVFLPTMELLFPVLLNIMTGLMNMSEPLKQIIGAFVLFVGVMGAVMTIAAMVAIFIAAVFVAPWVALGAAVVAVVVLIIVYWTDLMNFFAFIGKAFIDGVVITWTAIMDFLKIIMNMIVSQFKPVWQGLVSFFTTLWANLKNIFISGWNLLKGILLAPIETLKNAWNTIKSFFIGLWDGIKNIFSSAWSGIITALTASFTVFKTFINSIVDGLNKIIDGVNKVTGIGSKIKIDVPKIPNIPKLAEGGIVSKPTLAMIGEAGPEAVVPLGKGGAMGGINITQNLTITGSLKEEITNQIRSNNRDLVEQIKRLTGIRG